MSFLPILMIPLLFVSSFAQTNCICNCTCPVTPPVAPPKSPPASPPVTPPQTSSYWKPTGVVNWNVVYTTTPRINTSLSVYNIDMESTPQSFIDNVHKTGAKVICYFSAGSFENWRTDASKFPANVKGKPLDGWPGESWLDIRSNVVRDIMKARIQQASQKGCDAVDPDNVDGYTNPTGFPLTYNDQLNYNKFLIEQGHNFNMSVGLKNDLDQVKDLVDLADFAVNEQCLQYNECSVLKPFIDRKKTVFHIEYSGALSTICNKVRGMGFSTIKKTLALNEGFSAC